MKYSLIALMHFYCLSVEAVVVSRLERRQQQQQLAHSPSLNTLPRNSTSTSITRSAFDKIHAEQYDYVQGICMPEYFCGVNNQDDDCVHLGGVYDGSVTGYYNLDFGKGAATVTFVVGNDNPIWTGSSKILLYLDSIHNRHIASVTTGYTGSRKHWISFEQFLTFPVLGGVHDVYLSYVRDCEKFHCHGYFDVAAIDWFMFHNTGVEQP